MIQPLRVPITSTTGGELLDERALPGWMRDQSRITVLEGYMSLGAARELATLPQEEVAAKLLGAVGLTGNYQLLFRGDEKTMPVAARYTGTLHTADSDRGRHMNVAVIEPSRLSRFMRAAGSVLWSGKQPPQNAKVRASIFPAAKPHTVTSVHMAS